MLVDEIAVKTGKILDQFTKLGAGCCEDKNASHLTADLTIAGPAPLFDAPIGVDKDSQDLGLVLCLEKCTGVG